MNAIATAIVPICLLLVLGYIARRTQFLPDSFWQPAERATYYVLFPLLLINELAYAQFILADASIIIGYALAIPLIASALCLLALILLPMNASILDANGSSELVNLTPSQLPPFIKVLRVPLTLDPNNSCTDLLGDDDPTIDDSYSFSLLVRYSSFKSDPIS